jgi:hypothetical protein
VTCSLALHFFFFFVFAVSSKEKEKERSHQRPNNMLSRKGVSWLLLSTLFALVVSIATAQGNTQIDPALAHELDPDNTESFAYLPAHQDGKLSVGELSTIVAGVRIKEVLYGKMACYGIKADIGSPFQASQVIQNFTYAEPFFTVMTQKDKTLHLKIMPAKELSERKFFLTVYVLCKYLSKAPERAQEFASGLDVVNVAFNQTLDFVDTSNTYDGDFFLLVALLAFMAFAMLFAFTDLFHGETKKGAKKPAKKVKRVETGTRDANGDEWLEGTYSEGTYVPKKKK